MLVLLPPSETKRAGGSGRLSAEELSHGDALAEARARVRAALVALSGDEETAAKALKLGVKNRGELQRNLELGTSGTMPAIDRYTGVLYDALDAATLDDAARAWIDRNVLIQSALFGLIAADDEIPAYRVSGGSRLPDLGAPLKRVWAEAHADLPWPEGEFLLDLRSKDYAQLAPLPAGAGEALAVVQRGADGTVRALNHFNKAAKGDLVRRLARSGAAIASADELIAWAPGAGLEILRVPENGQLTLVTDLGAPGARSGTADTAG
ncbi:peroxide stress protein YaaA [Leucobacter sp. CSA2]|uniref:Peroxide stress protein YaaA n=1 Tax=Leucobacter edaphi TaxID=2796472 RepID=A0A934QDD4_9MICO|nr:peroxide stress protein YaaA [Leucobacter edaphi]MBK0422549.1 peroxide stress protein YaaA [Leucobacter edaphi]